MRKVKTQAEFDALTAEKPIELTVDSKVPTELLAEIQAITKAMKDSTDKTDRISRANLLAIEAITKRLTMLIEAMANENRRWRFECEYDGYNRIVGINAEREE